MGKIKYILCRLLYVSCCMMLVCIGVSPVLADNSLRRLEANGPGFLVLERPSLYELEAPYPSFTMPDQPVDNLPEGTVLAQELRLQIRELANQLFTTRGNRDLIGLIGLPVSFVNLNDFSETSPLGRYLAESMFYECNQRGLPIREYRMQKYIHSRRLAGSFILSRELPALARTQNWAAVLAGTYLQDEAGVFVNMRIVRANGDVIRTAQSFLPYNDLLARLLVIPPKIYFSTSSIRIQGPESN